MCLIPKILQIVTPENSGKHNSPTQPSAYFPSPIFTPNRKSPTPFTKKKIHPNAKYPEKISRKSLESRFHHLSVSPSIYVFFVHVIGLRKKPPTSWLPKKLSLKIVAPKLYFVHRSNHHFLGWSLRLMRLLSINGVALQNNLYIICFTHSSHILHLVTFCFLNSPTKKRHKKQIPRFRSQQQNTPFSSRPFRPNDINRDPSPHALDQRLIR